MGNNRPIGPILKDLRTTKRKELGEKVLTQEDVATSIRCTMKSYRRWEKGNELPSTTHLLALADLYNVDCDYLLGRMKEKTHNLAFICEKTFPLES